MNRNSQDTGISLPMVMGAVLVFSILVVLLSSIAVISIRHSNWALHRTEALAAAEAGAQDFVNRMNGLASFDSWTAERTKRFRERGAATGGNFPKVVADSALGQWKPVEGTSAAQYTYDIIGNNNGIIVRSTGRAGSKYEQKRTIEYRITRNSDSEVAYIGNRGYSSVDAYAQQSQLFTDTLWEQGLMGVDMNTGKRLSLSEYKQKCGDDSKTDWRSCWRQVWNGYDQVQGNFITQAPQTVHGRKSWMYEANSVDPQLFKYANISGSVTIQKSSPDRFTHAAGFPSGNPWGNPERNYYTDEEAAHMRGRDTWRYFPFDETIGSSPANYTVIREEASTFDSCLFRGSTQAIMYGDMIYVRSPHTPTNLNDSKNEWCKNKARSLWGKGKKNNTADISKQKIQAGDFLRPSDESSWVKFDNLPDDAVFIVQKTGTEGCNANVTGDQSSPGKSTGLGFPGAQAQISSADAGQAGLYDCKNGDLFIEGAVSFRRTFAAEDNIYLTGGIRYTDREESTGRLPVNSDDYLGLVARRNVIIYNPNPLNGSSTSCTGGCNKMPRTPYSLPTREQDLSTNEDEGQGAFATIGFDKYRRGLGVEGGIMNDPTSGKVDSKPTWLALPQYDAAIVAEEGAFFLENMNRLKDKPARKGRGKNETPLKVVVTGSVFSKYAPAFHIDRLPPKGNNAWTADSSQIEVYGLNMQFLFDRRFTKRLPPGFTGHSDSAYRATSYAEVFQGHLSP